MRKKILKKTKFWIIKLHHEAERWFVNAVQPFLKNEIVPNVTEMG